MTRLNLSEWAIRHRSLVTYFMLVLLVAGVASYLMLGRSEDPEFTIKTMVVQATWPGATAGDTLQQITDRLERKLQETPDLDYLKSYTSAGQSTIFVYLEDSTPAARVKARLEHALANDFPGVTARVYPLELGPPVGWPLQYRVSGPEPSQVRDIALRVAQVMGAEAAVRNINYNWMEPARTVRIGLTRTGPALSA